MTHVTATFAVSGSSYAEGELDIDPEQMTPASMAQAILDRLWAGISLCHQCAPEVSDPEADEVTSFTINGETWVARVDPATSITDWFLDS